MRQLCLGANSGGYQTSVVLLISVNATTVARLFDTYVEKRFKRILSLTIIKVFTCIPPQMKLEIASPQALKC